MTRILDILRRLLTTETLRMIGYGAIAVVWVVTRVALWAGWSTDAPALDTIAAAVSVGIAAVTEAARRFVYAPATVAEIRADERVHF
jgi:hypothetical protein